MEPRIFFKGWHLRVAVILLFTGSLYLSSFAQSSFSEKTKSYVVVGAFSMESNANKFTQRLGGMGLEVNKRFNESRGLHYVFAYELEPENRAEALDKAQLIKDQYPDLYDTWIYTGNFKGVYSPPVPAEEVAESDIEEKVPEVEEVIEEEIVADIEENQKQVITPQKKPEIVKEEGVYYIYANTINARNSKEVNGKVDISDPVRAKRIKLAETHQLLDVRDPNNGSKSVKLTPSIFGFKPTSRIISLDKPVADSTGNYVQVRGDSIIIDFELERFKKGDFAILFNVYFYKDAAIMKEESVYELNQLREMMQENENMRIKIHGHTNGNAFGKVLHLDENDKDFFNLKGAEHKEAAGSAKKLSLYRAVTIQRWLEDQGIDASRMETKGWGGKRPIADKLDSQAKKNVRVEIEVLAE